MTPVVEDRRRTSPGPAQRRAPAAARERLLTAALSQFAEHGALAPTLEDIRREADVSVGALYHHFADKAELAAALYVELTRDFQDGFIARLHSNPGAEDGIRAGVRFYLRWVGRDRASARFLLDGRPVDDPALRESNRAFLAEAIAWWQVHAHYGALRSLPLELIQPLWLGPAQEYTRHWLAGRSRRVPASVAEVLADAAWQALKGARR